MVALGESDLACTRSSPILISLRILPLTLTFGFFTCIQILKADSAFLCTPCDFKVHQANKLASRHERVRICDGCNLALADFTCKAGIAALCVACNIKVHSANTHAGQSPMVPFIVAPYVAHNDIADSLHVQELDFNQHAQNASHDDIIDSLHVQDMGFNQCAHNAAHINILDPLQVPKMYIIQPEHDDVVDDELCAAWLVQHISDSSKNDGESASMENKKGLMGWQEENFHIVESFMLSERCEENACMHVDSLVPSLAHNSSVASKAFQTYEAGYTKGTVSQNRFLTSTNGTGIVPDVALNCMSATKTPPCLQYMGHLCNSVAREARVLRYKEKRKNRNFEKIVRYASRKAYAEARPRVNGRFAKRPNEVSKQINFACDNDAHVFSVVPDAGFDVYQ